MNKPLTTRKTRIAKKLAPKALSPAFIVRQGATYDADFTARVRRGVYLWRVRQRVEHRLVLEQRWWARKYREFEHTLYLAITQHRLTD